MILNISGRTDIVNYYSNSIVMQIKMRNCQYPLCTVNSFKVFGMLLFTMLNYRSLII